MSDGAPYDRADEHVQCVCMYIYVYIYIYIHTHTYIQHACVLFSLIDGRVKINNTRVNGLLHMRV